MPSVLGGVGERLSRHTHSRWKPGALRWARWALCGARSNACLYRDAGSGRAFRARGNGGCRDCRARGCVCAGGRVGSDRRVLSRVEVWESCTSSAVLVVVVIAIELMGVIRNVEVPERWGRSFLASRLRAGCGSRDQSGVRVARRFRRAKSLVYDDGRYRIDGRRREDIANTNSACGAGSGSDRSGRLCFGGRWRVWACADCATLRRQTANLLRAAAWATAGREHDEREVTRNVAFQPVFGNGGYERQGNRRGRVVVEGLCPALNWGVSRAMKLQG